MILSTALDDIKTIKIMENYKNKAFLCYLDNEVMYLELSDEDAGKLIKAMFRYAKGQEVTLTREEAPIAYGYFVFLQGQYDRDKAKYEEKVAKKRKRDTARYAKQKGLSVELANEEEKSEWESFKSIKAKQEKLLKEGRITEPLL